MIGKLKVKGLPKYEPKLNPNLHLIYRKCDKMMDINSEELLLYAMKVGKKIKDFYVEFVNVNF